MSLLLLCLPFFLLPYLLPQLMWTRKAFIVYLFIAGSIAAYLTYDTLRLDPAERFRGPGGFLGVIIADLLAYGAGLGILVRLLGFLFAYKKIQRKFYWALLILAPILLIGILWNL